MRLGKGADRRSTSSPSHFAQAQINVQGTDLADARPRVLESEDSDRGVRLLDPERLRGYGGP